MKRHSPMSTTALGHIVIDTKGIAWIDDTNVKVVEVVLDKLSHGSSPEEMHLQYPHLSLAQIHAALAYYHDHKVELDAQISRDRAEIRSLRKQAGDSPGKQKLRAQGYLEWCLWWHSPRPQIRR